MSGDRRSIRLKGYDYAQAGTYFVTLGTQGRECLFGNVVDGHTELNDIGRIVAEEWSKTADIRHEVALDDWVVMPNHLHGIVHIVAGPVGAHGRAPLPRATLPLTRAPASLGSLVTGFKSAATKRINTMRNTPGAKIWQRNYYERIIRDERSLDRIRQYIADNPMRWALDSENPGNPKAGPYASEIADMLR